MKMAVGKPCLESSSQSILILRIHCLVNTSSIVLLRFQLQQITQGILLMDLGLKLIVKSSAA